MINFRKGQILKMKAPGTFVSNKILLRFEFFFSEIECLKLFWYSRVGDKFSCFQNQDTGAY